MIGNTKAWIANIGELRFGDINPDYNYAARVFEANFTVDGAVTTSNMVLCSVDVGPNVDMIILNMGTSSHSNDIVYSNGTYYDNTGDLTYYSTGSAITDRDWAYQIIYLEGEIQIIQTGVESSVGRTRDYTWQFIVYKY